MPSHRERHARRAAESPKISARVSAGDDAPHGMRLDKWLWAARFFKTRALAQLAVESGKVKHDGERCKPAHTVRIGDHYAIAREHLVWNVEVAALSDQRGSAAIASRLYSEPEESIAARTKLVAQRKLAMLNAPQLKGRPTKRQRRKIEDFLAEP
jgi:ribosome-associated heat shock protein Hsp15